VALDREITGLRETTELYEELGLDSAGTLELVLVLEEALGFEVDPEDLEIEVFRTVGTLADYISGHLVTTATATA
jgi:acyl carrier protein